MDLGCKYLWFKYIIIQTLFFIFFMVLKYIYFQEELLILINSKHLISLRTRILGIKWLELKR